MGLYSVVNGLISRMETTDTMNMLVLEKFSKRARGVAKDLGQSDDMSQQESFQSAMSDMARLYIGASAGDRGSIQARIEPEVQVTREKILLRGEAMLDSLQPASPGRSQMMREAAQEDLDILKRNLKGLTRVSDRMLLDVAQDTAPAKQNEFTLDRLHQHHSMSKSDRAHAKLVQKLHWLKEQHSHEPKMVISISEMMGATEMERYLISLDDTFGDLLETILHSDPTAHLPDLWCQRHDGKGNRATSSGVWWECQAADKKVLEAIMEQKSTQEHDSRTVGYDQQNDSLIRSVLKEGEYIIALVGNSGREDGMPVSVPRANRQPAAAYFQNAVFPNERVSKLLMMENGTDASHLIFDNRRFPHQTNPVFVELTAEHKNE